jgi:hypothetical protein
MTEEKQADEPKEAKIGKLSRRGALVGLAGLGVASAATGTASASSDHNHLGQYWSGDPGSPLKLDVGSGTDTALSAFSPSDTGTVLRGIAKASSGSTVGVEGKTESPDGVGLLGFASSTSGNAKGLEGRTQANNGSGVIGSALNGSGFGKGVRGTAKSSNGRGVEGVNTASSSPAYGIVGRSEADGGIGVRGRTTSSNGQTIGVQGESGSSGGYGLYTPDDAKVDGTLEVLGDIEVSGVKNFVQTVSSDAGPKQVKYTSVEAGEPQTEHSDVVEMEDGVAVVELPDHFGMVTSGDERLAVQVTPYCDEPVQPQVTDRSTDRIVVKDFSDGPDEYNFAYTVKGVRQGFEDQQVVSDSS